VGDASTHTPPLRNRSGTAQVRGSAWAAAVARSRPHTRTATWASSGRPRAGGWSRSCVFRHPPGLGTAV